MIMGFDPNLPIISISTRDFNIKSVALQEQLEYLSSLGIETEIDAQKITEKDERTMLKRQRANRHMGGGGGLLALHQNEIFITVSLGALNLIVDEAARETVKQLIKYLINQLRLALKKHKPKNDKTEIQVTKDQYGCLNISISGSFPPETIEKVVDSILSKV